MQNENVVPFVCEQLNASSSTVEITHFSAIVRVLADGAVCTPLECFHFICGFHFCFIPSSPRSQRFRIIFSGSIFLREERRWQTYSDVGFCETMELFHTFTGGERRPGKEESAPRYNLYRPQKPTNSNHSGLFSTKLPVSLGGSKNTGSEQLFWNVHFIFRRSLVSN